MPSRHGSAKCEPRPAAAVAALLLAASLAGCERPPEGVHHRLHALGTIVTLSYYGTDAEAAEAATAELERLYRRIGRDWYPWHEPGEGGELARINEAIARGEAIEVSARLAALLRRAVALEARSGGRYNVAIGALTRLWGFDDPLAGDREPPSAAAIDALLAGEPGGRQLVWNGPELRSTNRNIVLDPGGIAKGALLAMSARMLERRGLEHAIVDLGGDLRVIGTVAGRAARIGIRDPSGGPPPGYVEAGSGESVVTSGNYERSFEHGGKRYGHVIDPATGRPAEDAVSVTVLDEDAVLADAAATALLVAGPEGFDDTCRALGVDRALLIDARGDVRLTEQMGERVHWTGLRLPGTSVPQ